MKKIVLPIALFAFASNIYAAAYKIPEQSIKSVALSAAYVAGANEADTAYFNPANMSFLDEQQKFELSLTTIHLSKIKYKGKQIVQMNGKTPIYYRDIFGKSANNETKSETFLVPHIHYVSKPYGKLRYGLSLTTPAGLSKRWDNTPQSWSAKEFTLRVVEFNPTVSYQVNNNFSIGAGLRAVFTDGKIVLDTPKVKYNLDGDIKSRFGFNLALTYKIEQLTISSTYRSKVDLKEKGKASINDIINSRNLSTNGRVTVPLPATFTLATAIMLNEKAKFEVVYERTFWSSYENLDIKFDSLAKAYNIHKEKKWKDSNTFRVGLEYKNSNQLTTMYGLAYDKTPIPSKTLGYELPDSDALIFSLGAIYKYKENVSFGIAYLYDYKLKREITLADQNINGIVGEFSNAAAHLINLSFNYRF